MKNKKLYIMIFVICLGCLVFSLIKIITGIVSCRNDEKAYSEVQSQYLKEKTVPEEEGSESSSEAEKETEKETERETEKETAAAKNSEPSEKYTKESTTGEAETSAADESEILSGSAFTDSVYVGGNLFEKANYIMSVDISYLTTVQYELDFDTLTALNSDVIGWIDIPDTKINYPILQSEDNDDYVRLGVDRQPLNCGSIFVDCREDGLFTALNTVIYGHNQQNHMMFHDLTLFLDEDFFNTHRYFYIYTPDNVKHVCEIFAVSKVDAYSFVYCDCVYGGDDASAYVDELSKLSLYSAETSVSEKSTIVTLSTCANTEKNSRYILCAKVLN